MGIYTHTMGWRVAVSSLLLCGGALCRPSLLGAARGFPFQQNLRNQRHHGHNSHLHHRQGHSLEVTPLGNGLYGAPAELPSYGEEDLPVYTIPAAASSPSSSVSASGSMMMDPSYYFEYKSADSGFVIENKEDLAAALEKSAAEAALVKAKPYTGETVEVEYTGPNTEDSSYSYSYKGSDKAQQEHSAAGNVKGSYSFKTEDGQEFVVKYTSGVGGFVVDNLEELLAKANPQTAEYEAIVAEHAAATTAAARKSSGNANSPAAEVYVHEEIEAEPYNHEEIEAEAYVHQEIEAEPYIHEEIEAEPYIHEEIPYVHNEIAAEPYVHEEESVGSASRQLSSGPGMDASFMFNAVG